MASNDSAVCLKETQFQFAEVGLCLNAKKEPRDSALGKGVVKALVRSSSPPPRPTGPQPWRFCYLLLLLFLLGLISNDIT
jgi:hypothetical protein